MPWLPKLALGALLALIAATSQAHGGVSMEDDGCIMRIGSYRAHFAGYQPELRSTQEFCEDIPEVGRAIIVIDYLDSALRSRSVDFRILRDVRNLEAKARYDDLGGTKAIEATGIYRLPPATYPKGTITIDHRFSEAGWYIGLLSVIDPVSGGTVHSVFPFRVGVHSWQRYVPVFIVVIAFPLILYRLTGKKRKPPTKSADDRKDGP